MFDPLTFRHQYNSAMPLKRCPFDGLECCFDQCEGELCKDRGDVWPDDYGVWRDRNDRVVPSESHIARSECGEHNPAIMNAHATSISIARIWRQ